MKENKEAIEELSIFEEIEFKEILQKLWEGRKIVSYSIVVFIFIGILIIIGTPKEYRSDVKILVEYNQGSSSVSSLIQQYGGFAGLNFNALQLNDVLTPDIYPDIIKSTPFLLEILYKKVYYSKQDTFITVFEYFDKYNRPSVFFTLLNYTILLPLRIIERNINENERVNFKAQSVDSLMRVKYLKISRKQGEILKQLVDRIKINQDETFTTLTISVEIQDPLISAQLIDLIVKSLTNYITYYRTQKAQLDLDFIIGKYVDAEKRFFAAQKKLANFRDKNKNIVQSSYKIEEERLQFEYNLAFNEYNSLYQQLVQAEINVQEQSPMLKIIDPPKVPLKNSKPRTIFTLITMIFLGAIIGIGAFSVKLIWMSKK